MSYIATHWDTLALLILISMQALQGYLAFEVSVKPKTGGHWCYRILFVVVTVIGILFSVILAKKNGALESQLAEDVHRTADEVHQFHREYTVEIGHSNPHSQLTTNTPIPQKAPPKITAEVSGVIFTFSITTYENSARVQLTVTAQNSGTSTYGKRWKLIARFPAREVDGTNLIGQEPIPGSIDLPALNDQELVTNKPVSGFLYFELSRLTRQEIDSLNRCPSQGTPVDLVLSFEDTTINKTWPVKLDLAKLYEEKCIQRGAQPNS